MTKSPIIMSTSSGVPSFTDQLALGEAKRGDNKRRVIVTGGSGKLGRSTVRYLADEGWEVISVDTRRPAGISEDGKSGLGGAYRLVEIDLEDMGAVLETFISTVRFITLSRPMALTNRKTRTWRTVASMQSSIWRPSLHPAKPTVQDSSEPTL